MAKVKEKWLTPFHGYGIKKVISDEKTEFIVYDYDNEKLDAADSVKNAHLIIKRHASDHSFIVRYVRTENEHIEKPCGLPIKANDKDDALERAKKKLDMTKYTLKGVYQDWDEYFEG